LKQHFAIVFENGTVAAADLNAVLTGSASSGAINKKRYQFLFGLPSNLVDLPPASAVIWANAFDFAGSHNVFVLRLFQGKVRFSLFG